MINLLGSAVWENIVLQIKKGTGFIKIGQLSVVNGYISITENDDVLQQIIKICEAF